MSKELNELSESLLDHLRRPTIVVVATVSTDGGPSLDLLSWVWPMDARTVRLVISPHLPGSVNMRANGRATLQVVDDGLAHEVRGAVHLIKERCESVRFPQAMYDLAITSVRENIFPATRVTGPIPYARAPATEAVHAQIDEAVYQEIRTTPRRDR